MLHSDRAIVEAKERRRDHEKAVENHRISRELSGQVQTSSRRLHGLTKLAVRLVKVPAIVVIRIGRKSAAIFHRRLLKHARQTSS